MWIRLSEDGTQYGIIFLLIHAHTTPNFWQSKLKEMVLDFCFNYWVGDNIWILQEFVIIIRIFIIEFFYDKKRLFLTT